VATILPKVVKSETGSHTLMPWNPGYDAAPGEGVTPGLAYPDHLRRRPDKFSRSVDFSGRRIDSKD